MSHKLKDKIKDGIKTKRHLSIKSHIFISMLALTLVMILIMWLLQTTLLTSVYKLTKESEIKRATAVIADNIENDDLDELITKISIEYELCAMLFRFGSRVEQTHSEHFLNDCILHQLTDYETLFSEWYQKAQDDKDKIFTIIVPRDAFRDFEYDSGDFEGEAPDEKIKDDCLISVRIIDKENGEKLMLIVNTFIEPVQATVRAMRVLLFFISVIFFLISILISYILSLRLSAPIAKINRGARGLGRTEKPVVFEEDSGPREVVELAKTLNQASTELTKVENLRRELIANISHDLRTPLTMISGYSEVIRDIPGENTPENIQVIIDEASRLTSLVNDLLNVSKLQSGTQVMDIKRISITSVVLETVKRYDRLCTHDGYTIKFEHDGEAFIMADEIRLLQVVYNLINNAINYTGADKTVVVKQTVEDSVVRISVIDSGDGISEENLPLIWDRYYKVDKVHKRAMVGTGIGLSIVKNILLLHGSRFGVSSELGKGSIFWFEFKSAPQAEANTESNN